MLIFEQDITGVVNALKNNISSFIDTFASTKGVNAYYAYITKYQIKAKPANKVSHFYSLIEYDIDAKGSGIQYINLFFKQQLNNNLIHIIGSINHTKNIRNFGSIIDFAKENYEQSKKFVDHVEELILITDISKYIKV